MYQVMLSTVSLICASIVSRNSFIIQSVVADVIHSRAWMFDSIKTTGLSSLDKIFNTLSGRPSNDSPMVKTSTLSG